MSTDGVHDPDSILGNLQGEPISYEDAQNYDITVDLLNRVITYLTGSIANIEGNPPSGSDEIVAASGRRDHYIGERNALKPEDGRRVQQLRDECVGILKNEAGY